MHRRNFLAGTTTAALLAGCSTSGSNKFRRYSGPPVTRVVVNKGDRKMFLEGGRRTLKVYDIELGFAPVGHKQFEGDGKTPEGDYIIDRRNPNSRFHLSLGISYPSARDVAYARAMGKDPGGEIFIHGQQNPFKKGRGEKDWTWGCISVTNRHMEDIYAMVRNGTPIRLNA